MDITEIMSAISTVGFPISMCVAFFVWFTNNYKHEQESTREVVGELKETVNGLKATVEALTLIVKKGVDKDE